MLLPLIGSEGRSRGLADAPLAQPHTPRFGLPFPVPFGLLARCAPLRPQSTMAGHLAPHLSHKSALALLLPPALSPPIEAVRRVHDRSFARWPPHINLIYPFLASPSEDAAAEQPAEGMEPTEPRLKQDIRSRIQCAIKDIQPFHMTLTYDQPGIFSHGKKSKTVWLPPSSKKVCDLQAALQAEFAECDADTRPFVPHLSVGQARSASAAQALREEITKSISDFLDTKRADAGDARASLDWSVEEVFVIERKGFNDRFKVVGVISLGKA